jgi:phage terminase Nu1 subunit (DNA packaging protein)
VADDLNPAHLTADQAAKVRAKTISNILKKISKGGTPTLAEQKMLDDATTQVKGTLKGYPIGVKEVAELTGYTTQRIDQLFAEGVAVKLGHGKYDAFATLQNMFSHVRTKKTNQYDSDPNSPEGQSYEAHRARLTKAKADMAEMDAELKKGTVHAAEAVAIVWGDMIGNARAKLLGIPVKLAGALDGLNITERQEVLKLAITEALQELASYRPEVVTGEWEKKRRSDEETEDDTDA